MDRPWGQSMTCLLRLDKALAAKVELDIVIGLICPIESSSNTVSVRANEVCYLVWISRFLSTTVPVLQTHPASTLLLQA